MGARGLDELPAELLWVSPARTDLPKQIHLRTLQIILTEATVKSEISSSTPTATSDERVGEREKDPRSGQRVTDAGGE